MTLHIRELKKDGLQTRVSLDERTVSEYSEAMREWDVFPPVTVFNDGRRYWLADGFHRVEAALRAGLAIINVEMREGGFIDALRYALKCNVKHGKRLTNEDKRRALEMAWEKRVELFGGDPSSRMLAEACGTSPRLAAKFIAEQTPVHNAQVSPVRAPVRGRDGKVYQMPVRAPVSAPQRPTGVHNAQVAPVRTSEKSEIPQKPQHIENGHLVPCDRYGTEIPLEIGAAFETDALQAVLSAVSAARSALRRGFDEKDARFAAVRQDALIHLNNAYNFLAAAKPHCVCRMCQGNGCKACHERGWQTEEEYDRNPKEFKA